MFFGRTLSLLLFGWGWICSDVVIAVVVVMTMLFISIIFVELNVSCDHVWIVVVKKIITTVIGCIVIIVCSS